MLFKDPVNSFTPRTRSPGRNIHGVRNVVHSKIVCLEKDEALQWPQYERQTSTTAAQRRVIEEVVQYLMYPQDSALLVNPVTVSRKQRQCDKANLVTMPTEIHLMVSRHLNDYDALCLSLSCRTLFNKSLPRVQKIVCPLDTLGCWSGKTLVRADPSNPTPTATAVEAQYLEKTTAAMTTTPSLRRNETLYLAAFPHQRLVLHNLAHNMHIPQVVRRFVSATLRDKEYENMFRPGEEYVLRNVDRREYVPFTTSKIRSCVVDVNEIKEGEEGMMETLHAAELLIDAISCAPEDAIDRSKFEKGSWAGCRIDIVLKKRVESEQAGWTLASRGDATRAYVCTEEARGRWYRDGNGLVRDRSRTGSANRIRDKSVGKRNRMYSFLGKEKFVLPCQPRVLVDGRIMWA
ncbi:hypothetical protein Dda_6357 [Drechslerella dactyloides]|uniref:F-box domain-containing protein n=1 Tax=Drechslerella dactyloides TaxID=74499 RepID=A0AAD6ITW8_DREDA|nr:hypothetical protein Dda_6357 [Drechslerella dactyloides]